ncbi:MAG: hypothetical protein HC822_22430 [Oscillochloris sp.]|nr:hypothetical protein [Oscillochloris sp.]
MRVAVGKRAGATAVGIVVGDSGGGELVGWDCGSRPPQPARNISTVTPTRTNNLS